MPLARQPVHQRFVQPGPLVLGSTLLKSPAPTADRDRTVSRRSKPSSRTALMGEQPNPWDRLQPQDATSRHRTFLCRFRQRRLYLHPARSKRGVGVLWRRSEEHTSELQSHLNLVCPLLLQKKKDVLWTLGELIGPRRRAGH